MGRQDGAGRGGAQVDVRGRRVGLKVISALRRWSLVSNYENANAHSYGALYSKASADRLEIDAQEAVDYSKCAREIGRTVSQFRNVLGQASQFLNVPRSGRMP